MWLQQATISRQIKLYNGSSMYSVEVNSKFVEELKQLKIFIYFIILQYFSWFSQLSFLHNPSIYELY